MSLSVELVVAATFLVFTMFYVLHMLFMLEKRILTLQEHVDRLTTRLENYRAEAATKRYR